MNIVIRGMSHDDYDQVLALWQATEGVGLNDADEREPIGLYLKRNNGLSVVACDRQAIVGAVLCGHDGRRGYLHHLAVAESYRGRGIGRSLVENALSKLRAEGMSRCHLFVYKDNCAGKDFWRKLGWVERTELTMLTKGLAD